VTAFLIGLALIVAGAVAAAAFRTHPRGDAVVRTLLVVGCLTAAGAAVWALATGAEPQLSFRSGVPGGDWVFVLDPLSSAFVFTICSIGAASAAFGVPYMAPEREHHAVWYLHVIFALLLVGLALVVTAQSIVPFLCAWEVMAIGSYFLIVTDGRAAEMRRAGFIYLVATHTGTLALFAMFALWSSGAADWSFASLAAASPALPYGGAAVLALAMIGFGVKAGIVPFHFWLPPAHAAAPSHVSAVLSGVVIKVGIYGILRVVMMLGGAPPRWWGWTMLALGVASGVLGVLWALAQHDIKCLLAYHSVENIGIIAMGIGIGSLGTAYGQPVVATLGYAGALLHTLNHALFKSLLFLGAGVAARITGTREIDRMGGLAKLVPVTWVSFLIGSTAIIGVPPLNGFVSEWLVYVGMFRAALGSDALRFATLGIPALALIGGLALACFAKVGGIVFLGTPRASRVNADAARATERPLIPPLIALAAACVLLGIGAPLGVWPALSIAQRIVGEGAGALRSDVVSDASWIAAVALGTFGLVGLLWLLRWALLRRRQVRASETWGCGYPMPTPRMQYTASSFAAPLVTAFGRISGVTEHRSASEFVSHPVDLVLDGVAVPAWARLRRAALRLRPMQQGRLHIYLLYVMVALVAMLAYLALAA
jgi:hydrogenase-4 component B